MQGVRTGIIVDDRGASSSKVSTFQGVMDILEDDGSEIIMLKQYLDLLASAGSERLAYLYSFCVYFSYFCCRLAYCREFNCVYLVNCAF